MSVGRLVIVRTSMRSAYIWMSTAAGVLAGVTAWAFGPRLALALVTGIGGAAALLFVQWLRIRYRGISTDFAHLRRQVTAGLGEVERRLDGQVSQQLAACTSELGKLQKQLATLDRRNEAVRRQEIAQIQALQNLYAMVPVRRRMPPLEAGWAVSPDFMLLLLSIVQERRPATIIELGSGASTVWTALLLREQGIGTRVITIDHDLNYVDLTRERLVALELDKQVELRHAPLVDVELDGEVYPWYDRTAFLDVECCDLLVVDGPPGNLRPRSRYPALPVLGDRMPAGAQVLLDDYQRSEEHQLVSDWLKRIPGWQVKEYRYAKGAALLTRTAWQ